MNHLSLSLSNSEQDKIATFFTLIDRKIELLTKIIDCFIKIKKYLLNNLFVNQNNKTPLIRFPQFHEEWQQFQLKDIVKIQKKTNLLSSVGQPTGLYQFFVCSHDGTHKYLDQYCFDGEYLVVNNGGTMYTNYVNDKFAVTSHCLVLKVIKNETKFLYFLLKNKEQQINHFGFQGLAIKNINLNYFLNLKLFFPDNIHEQTKISDFLTLINQKIEIIQQQKEKIIQIKKYLLNKMFVNN